MINSTNPASVLQALLKAQLEFPSIPKRGFNPHFKSNFATLKDTKAAIDPILTKHGLGVVQLASQLDGKPALTTLLVNGDAEYFGDVTPLSLTKQDPQAHGSALTYMKRYCYSAILGLLTDEEDDDGNVGSGREPAEKAGRNIPDPRVAPQQSIQLLSSAVERAGESKESAAEWFRKAFKKEIKYGTAEELSQAVEHYTAVAVGKELAG